MIIKFTKKVKLLSLSFKDQLIEVNGMIIKRMVLAFKSQQMARNMKVSGKGVKDLEEVLYGSRKVRNM
jgi:hypothetical protein